MGKGKRSRDSKANDILVSAKAPKTKKSGSIDGLTKVLLIVVTLIIVASLALTYINTSGILLRAPKAFKSENFEISGSMMQYMFYSQYTAFVTNYSSYLSTIGLSTSKSLKAQKCTTTYKSLLTSLYGEDIKTDGTWFEFFWDVAEKQAKQTLVFCEAAKALGIELTDEEIAEIDKTIDSIGETATLYGYPNTQSYINAMYGAGVNKSDIRKTLLLSELSAKLYEVETDRIKNEITDEAVLKFFEDNKSDYYKADYYTLAFQVTKETIDSKDTEEQKAAKLEKFKADIEKAKAHAAAVAALTDAKAIKDYMIAYWADDYYASYLSSTETELKKNDSKTGKPTITIADIPTDDTVKDEYKAAVIAAAKEAIEKETADADLKDMTLAGNAYDKVLTSVRNKLITQIKKNIDSMIVEEIAYSDSSDEFKWIFAEERAKGDSKVFASDDKADEFKVDEATSFKATAYIIEKSRYIQEELVKEFGHILITANAFKNDKHDNCEHKADDKDAVTKCNEEKAKAEAERLLAEFEKGEKTKEAFEALAKDKNEDSNEFYADTKPGQMVEEINDFLFSDETKVGDTKVIKTTYGYHVTWLVGEGKEIYFVDAKADLNADLVEKWIDELEAKYAVTANASVADKIDA